MGNFDDLIPKSGGSFDDLIPKTQKPTYGGGIGLAGPVAKGTDYVNAGLGVGDIPHVGAKFASGFLGGVPEAGAKKPIATGLAGPFGAWHGKDEGVNYFPQPQSEGGRMAGRDLELIGGVIDPELAVSNLKGLPQVNQPVRRFGRRLMQGILKPKGELAEKSAQIAETALKEGLVGSKEGMLDKTYKLLQKGGEEIGEIVKKAKDKKIDLKVVFNDLKELRKKYKFAQNDKKVRQIDDLIEQFKPAFKEKKTIKSYRRVGGEFDKAGEYTPNTKLVKQKRTVNRSVPLEEAQARKVAVYQDLAEGKSFPMETSSADVAGRKAYAKGFRKAAGKVVPEIREKNKRFGDLSEVAQAIEDRLPIEQRQQLFGLGDVILGAAGTVNPKALGVGAIRRLLQMPQLSSRIAQKAWKYGKSQPSMSLAYPAARYLTSGE